MITFTEQLAIADELQRLRADCGIYKAGFDIYREIRQRFGIDQGESVIKFIDSLRAELAALQERYDEEVAIVNRIWAIFGTPSYEELEGRTIYDLVQAAQNQATVMHDMHKALGIKWGDDPYAVITALQADARRYRWLRAQEEISIAACWLLPVDYVRDRAKPLPATIIKSPEELDAAIDAAMKDKS